MLGIAESNGADVEHTAALVVDLVRPVDHDLADLWVVEQRLNRAVAQHLVDDRGHDLLLDHTGDVAGEFTEHFRHGGADVLVRFLVRERVERAHVEVLQDAIVDATHQFVPRAILRAVVAVTHAHDLVRAVRLGRHVTAPSCSAAESERTAVA